MTRDGCGVAECDHNGTIPRRPRDVRWIATAYLPGNYPDPTALHTFEQARDIAVNLVRNHLRGNQHGLDSHGHYAVIYVTPDGWRPIMWATPDPNHPHQIRLTLHEGTRP